MSPSIRAVAFGAITLAALGVGFGTGYALWGRTPDWYAAPNMERLPSGSESDLIRHGWRLVVETARHIGKDAADASKRYAGNNLACTNCHLQAGRKPFAAPFVSTFATFPMLSDDRVLTLAERINGCMTRSMNGRAMPEDGREMEALIAYIRFAGTGSPQAVRVPGMGLRALPRPSLEPDAGRGQTVYSSVCARCHKADGQGEPFTTAVGYEIPPLWGDASFNSTAGMGQLATAAAFIRNNMPLGVDYRAPMLTDQQAWDVASFITTRPRPKGPPR